MSKKIDNHLARAVPHTHPADEQYRAGELRNHMIKYHGWTVGMVRQKGWAEDGAYIRRYHQGAHQTAHLDPPTEHQPKEW
jgi:hypothetical protein